MPVFTKRRRSGEHASLSCQDFPDRVRREEINSIAEDEAEFHWIVATSPKIQRRLGWSAVVKSSTLFPDVIAMLLGGGEIRVELEFSASNYARHKHPHTADILLCLVRNVGEHFVSGVPVWSFYRRGHKSEMLEWCLDRDIRGDRDS